MWNDELHIAMASWLGVLTYVLLTHRKRNRQRWGKIDDLVSRIEKKIGELRENGDDYFTKK